MRFIFVLEQNVCVFEKWQIIFDVGDGLEEFVDKWVSFVKFFGVVECCYCDFVLGLYFDVCWVVFGEEFVYICDLVF